MVDRQLWDRAHNEYQNLSGDDQIWVSEYFDKTAAIRQMPTLVKS
jgi:hypothetical protein